jgi:hypothetical protein
MINIVYSPQKSTKLQHSRWHKLKTVILTVEFGANWIEGQRPVPTPSVLKGCASLGTYEVL